MVLLTNDKDFADVIRYPPSSHSGVIVMRITAATEREVHNVLIQMLSERKLEHLDGALAIVSRNKYRLRC